tara:strand:- start:30 stop:608 length:579 start_codon:yes stop_codon:yes gene_type:complete
MGQIQFNVSNGKGSMMVNGYHENEYKREHATTMALECLDYFYNSPVEWLSEVVSKRFIKEIRGYRYPSANWAGKADSINRVLKINLGVIPDFDQLKSVVEHEKAHIWYRYNQNNEIVKEFNKEVLTDKYWINFYSKRKLNKWSDQLFCNEMHSILTEYKYAPKTNYTDKNRLDDKASVTLTRYMKAYNTLHR